MKVREVIARLEQFDPDFDLEIYIKEVQYEIEGMELTKDEPYDCVYLDLEIKYPSRLLKSAEEPNES